MRLPWFVVRNATLCNARSVRCVCSMLASTESAPFRARRRCPPSPHPVPLARPHCVLSPVVKGCHASQIHFRQCRGRVCPYGCRATGLVRVPLLAQRGRTTVLVLNEHRGLVASECCRPQGSLPRSAASGEGRAAGCVGEARRSGAGGGADPCAAQP